MVAPSLAADPPSTRQKRLRRTAEQTRLLILIAASDLFAERGYLGASLGDISERSGVAKSNIFHFYKNKDELWKDAVDYTFNKISALVDVPVLHNFDPTWDLFEGFLREHILTCARFPNYVKIPLMEGSQRSWRTEWLAERHIKPSMIWFERFLAPFVAKGMLPAGKAFELQALLSGGAQLLFSEQALFADALGKDMLGETFAADYAKFVVGVLRKAATANM